MGINDAKARGEGCDMNTKRVFISFTPRQLIPPEMSMQGE